MPVISGKNRPNRQQKEGILILTKFTKWVRNCLTLENLKDFLFNPDSALKMAILMFVAEIFINFLVIAKVPYTEIDWIAYMQEVQGVKNGTFDYAKLKGRV